MKLNWEFTKVLKVFYLEVRSLKETFTLCVLSKLQPGRKLRKITKYFLVQFYHQMTNINFAINQIIVLFSHFHGGIKTVFCSIVCSHDQRWWKGKFYRGSFRQHRFELLKAVNCAQSCLTLCIPMDGAHQAPLSMEFFQARILEGVTISSSRIFQPRDQTLVTWVSWIDRQILYHCTTWKARGELHGPPILGFFQK